MSRYKLTPLKIYPYITCFRMWLYPYIPILEKSSYNKHKFRYSTFSLVITKKKYI